MRSCLKIADKHEEASNMRRKISAKIFSQDHGRNIWSEKKKKEFKDFYI